MMRTADPAKLPAGPRGRILRASEAKAWQDGYGLLESARREAEELRKAARQAYAAEYAQGYEEGRVAGSAEAARLVSETAVKIDRYLASIEGEVVNLALDVVRRILGEFDVAMLVGKAARQAIAELRRAKYIKISVHPGAVVAVREELSAVLGDAELGLTVEIDADSRLAEGACILSTDTAIVDASLDVQLAAIAAAVAGSTGDGT